MCSLMRGEYGEIMEFTTVDGKKMNGIHGYKGLSKNNTNIYGKHFQFEPNKLFTEDCEPRFKQRGFHFCIYLEDVKRFVPNCAKIYEVFATGEVEGNGSEYATNQIYIGKEITV